MGKGLLLGLGQMAALAGAVMGGLFVALEGGVAGTPNAGLSVVFAAALAALVCVPLLPALTALAPRQVVLRWASIYLVAVNLPFAFLQDYWLLWWVLLSLGLALVLPLRVALVLTAARAMNASATRLLTLGIFLSLAAAVGGLVVGYALWRLEGPGVPLPFAYAVGLLALSLAVTLAPPFASDRPAPHLGPAWPTMLARLWQAPTFRWGLVAGGFVRGGFIALVCWILLPAPGERLSSGALNLMEGADSGLRALIWFFVGAALASLITALQPHPCRIHAFLPPALSALALVLLLMTGADRQIGWLPALGWIVGFLLPPLQNAVLVELEEDEQLPGEMLRRGVDVLAAALWGLFFLAAGRWLSPAQLVLVPALLACAGALASWYMLRREVAEVIFEAMMLPFYRVRATGPGLEAWPKRGPVIVIANHACWFDPIFLGKVLPRKTFPMMTSVFFDIPILHWVMVNVAQAVRVQATRFRREVPELKDALAVLDRGDTLVVFAEGIMRRKPDLWLKRFGRGIVYLLRERPQTSIVTCWIEGNWGSYASYYNGPPTKNKRVDFLRPIRVAVAAPCFIDPELLEDHLAARAFLRRQVAETRTLLGLEAAPLGDAEADEADE